MKDTFAPTAPAAYTGSFAAAVTVAAMLGLAAGAKTAKAWDEQASEAAISSAPSQRAAQGFVPRHSWLGAFASSGSRRS